jgi:hypothetical protein
VIAVHSSTFLHLYCRLRWLPAGVVLGLFIAVSAHASEQLMEKGGCISCRHRVDTAAVTALRSQNGDIPLRPLSRDMSVSYYFSTTEGVMLVPGNADVGPIAWE